ncbi:hypothetical protein F2P56_013961 [Juglans regia]|uniref:HTH myb-type domain-containing protein n=1 Tax=Juglans regia TaxID=51240 RepID=A0A833XCA0_JUGRE|nr:hypothetical protein F2P56_013961 [Juglans regia]
MELTLDLSRVFVPKTISELVREISTAGNSSEKLSKLHDCVQRLEDERSKIEGFKRELPLCMNLLNDAIGRLKEAAMHCMESDNDDKKNWMNSAQLWITGPDYDYKKEESASEAKLHGEEDDWSVLENPIQPQSNRNMGGNFPSLKEENEVSQVTSLSLMTPLPELNPSDSVSKRRTSFGCRGSNSGSSLLTEPPRKQRRYWSPQLHRCFLEAVQQLGGEQVATPKQIRELMQVDGLTNDEVKSHLQISCHGRNIDFMSKDVHLLHLQMVYGWPKINTENAQIQTPLSLVPQRVPFLLVCLLKIYLVLETTARKQKQMRNQMVIAAKVGFKSHEKIVQSLIKPPRGFRYKYPLGIQNL